MLNRVLNEALNDSENRPNEVKGLMITSVYLFVYS